jgi:hypothetical protein
LDDAYQDFQKNGGMDDNPYKGKPIPIEQGGSDEAVLNSVLKNANVLPPWLELQKEIRDLIKNLIDKMPALSDPQIDAEVSKVNEKVKKYNNMCPPPLQKTRLFTDTIEKQFEKWC